MLETEVTPLPVVTLAGDDRDLELVRTAFDGLSRYRATLDVVESFSALLSRETAHGTGLLVLNDHGPRGEDAKLVRRLRTAGYSGAVLVLVGETSEPKTFITAGADATLDRQHLDPIFVESIVGVALTRPHRR